LGNKEDLRWKGDMLVLSRTARGGGTRNVSRESTDNHRHRQPEKFKRREQTGELSPKIPFGPAEEGRQNRPTHRTGEKISLQGGGNVVALESGEEVSGSKNNSSSLSGKGFILGEKKNIV